MQNQKNPDEIGAFWEKEGREGIQYFSGEINGERVVMFLNKYHHKGDKLPMFHILKTKENPNYQKKESAPIIQDAELKDIPF